MAEPSSSSFTTPWVTYPQIYPNYHTNYMYGVPKNEVSSSTWNPGKWHKLNTAQNRHCMVLTLLLDVSPSPRQLSLSAPTSLLRFSDSDGWPRSFFSCLFLEGIGFVVEIKCITEKEFNYWLYLFRHGLQTSKFQIPYLKSFFPLGWQTWVTNKCQYLSQLQCFFV